MELNSSNNNSRSTCSRSSRSITNNAVEGQGARASNRQTRTLPMSKGDGHQVPCSGNKTREKQPHSAAEVSKIARLIMWPNRKNLASAWSGWTSARLASKAFLGQVFAVWLGSCCCCCCCCCCCLSSGLELSKLRSTAVLSSTWVWLSLLAGVAEDWC
ncbi:hypothetical protein PoB_000419300 [Plakobranchus ocellatus]|uniref:Uncharacterized protein n=1 Tax=Plakobranchus ocellatus TaxID=259542 RepID=A0AAV3Y549_9GAST|nr:hypothetical protein PoB_000419300 [Plakobranchus ocellatus]